MRGRHRILVVDDEPTVTEAMRLILSEQGYEVETATTPGEADTLLTCHGFSLVFTDLRLPGESGIDLLSRIKSNAPDTEVVLMTAHGSLDVTIEAIKRGAFYYLEKPFTPDQVVMLTRRAVDCVAIKLENDALKRALSGEVETFGMVGHSPAMRQIYETIGLTASSDASVLIEGESGTGKELIAAAFHFQSLRSPQPFIRINCAAIPRELMESELFGYKKGAFTGANHDKRGLMEAARGGTLLLDEIAEMPTHLQAKLLRVLQERKLRRVGDEREIDVDFRLISATNRDTSQAMRDFVLRDDLYYRISTIKIKVPPLRERLEDLPLLVECFLRRYGEKYKKAVRRISEAPFAALARYQWPGNVRELESVVEHAVLFSRGDELTLDSLPTHVRKIEPGQFRCAIAPYMTLEEIEREAIEQALQRTGGNVKRTAEILNLHRPTLYRKLRRLGIKSIAHPDGNALPRTP